MKLNVKLDNKENVKTKGKLRLPKFTPLAALAAVALVAGMLAAIWAGGNLIYQIDARQYNMAEQRRLRAVAISQIRELKQIPAPPADPDINAGNDSNEGPIDLNDIEYKVVTNELQRIIDEQDPLAALNWLDAEQKVDKKIARSCHGLAHETGRRAYKKYQNFSVALSSANANDVCANGFVHGVIEGHFALVTDVYAEVAKVCSASDYSCVHGIGHGLMYFTNNDIPKSLDVCYTLGDWTLIGLCSEGTYHENYETNSREHTSKFLNPDDPFGVCRESWGIPGSCYYYGARYLVRVFQDDYTRALNYCQNNVPGEFQYTCARGVGSILVRQNIQDPPFVLAQCVSAPSALVSGCIYGATIYHQFNARTAWETKDTFCDKLDGGYYTNLCNSINGTA